MNTIREVLFDLLFNAFLQVGFFAIVAAAFSLFIAKAKAKYQHSFYLGLLVLCMAVPTINTLWHTPPSAIAEKSLQNAVHQPGSSDPYSWVRWKYHDHPPGTWGNRNRSFGRRRLRAGYCAAASGGCPGGLHRWHQ